MADFKIVVRPSAFWLLLTLPAVGLVAYSIHLVAAEVGAVGLSPVELWFVALFPLGYFALGIIHELGHGFAFLAVGLRWDRLTIQGGRLSVHASGHRTWASQLLISPAGPLLQIAASALLLSNNDLWSLLGLLGAAGCIEGVFNLLVPYGRNADATKMYRALWAIARGRARVSV